MQKPARRAPSPPVPTKPSHLSVGALNLGNGGEDVEQPVSGASSGGDPFDDKFQSGQNSLNNSSNSSLPEIIESSSVKAVESHQSAPQLLHDSSDPFSDRPSSDKPNLPPRPMLPPRPSVAASITSTRPSTSTPSLTQVDPRTSIGSASIPVVDRQKNELSNLFKKPPPLSRLSAGARKISGGDNSSTITQIQGSSMLLKIKEDIHVPNSDKSYKSLPITDHLATHEILQKGVVRGFAVSGFYIATGGQSIRVWYSPSGENKTTVSLPSNDAKVHSLNFAAIPPSEKPDFYDQFVWVGLEKGELMEFDMITGEVSARSSTHSSTVTHIVRGPKEMLTIDEHGALRIWLPDSRGKVSLAQRPHALRIQAKPACAILANGLLWTSQGKFIEVYCLQENASTILEKRIDSGQGWSIASPISALSYNPKTMEVYASHDSGKISVYSCNDFERKLVVQATSYKITTMLVVVNRIWIGLSTGKILIFEPLADGWICILDFLAYQNSSVAGLSVDDRSVLAGAFNVVVVSISDSGLLKIWDGLLRNYLIDVKIRESVYDYSEMSPVNIAIITYNIDSRKPSDIENDVFERFVAERPDTDVFVFGFQELVDLENKGMTAKTFLVGSNKAAKALDSTLDERLILWQDRLQKLFPATYSVLHVSQLVGLFQFIISKNTFAVKDIATSHIKTGMGGLYGNKGAIATRFFIRDSSFCFVNTHLAAHQSHTSERNKDIAQILKDGSFPKLELEHHFEGGGDGSMILDHEHVFWSGDLNYRIDDTRQAVVDNIEKGDWPSLWHNDQLLRQKSENKSFGLRIFSEMPLSFPPTFKYNRGTDQYDTSEKMRIPAYCDRILRRGDRCLQHTYARLEIKMSDHRPIIADFTAQAMQIDFTRLSQSLSTAQQLIKNLIEANVVETQQLFLMDYFSLTYAQAGELLSTRAFTSFFLTHSPKGSAGDQNSFS